MESSYCASVKQTWSVKWAIRPTARSDYEKGWSATSRFRTGILSPSKEGIKSPTEMGYRCHLKAPAVVVGKVWRIGQGRNWIQEGVGWMPEWSLAHQFETMLWLRKKYVRGAKTYRNPNYGDSTGKACHPIKPRLLIQPYERQQSFVDETSLPHSLQMNFAKRWKSLLSNGAEAIKYEGLLERYEFCR